MVEQHLQLSHERFPLEKFKRDLYLDDLIGERKTSAEVLHLNKTSQTIFEANFELHKWHSNDPDLETSYARSEKA